MSRPLIGLAVEAPEVLHERLLELTDLDFALAHRVLESASYASWFAARNPQRMLILDNSVHELGTPLQHAQLVKAAAMVKADFVVAPDNLSDPNWTEAQFFGLHADAGRAHGWNRPFEMAAVLCGEVSQVRARLLRSFSDAGMLCLPYRRPRLQWWEEHQEELAHYKHIHLLGLQTLQEARAWVSIAQAHPAQLFTLDTSKPVKWGLCNRQIDSVEDLHGAPISSRELLELPRPSAFQWSSIQYNLEVLREILVG